MFTTTDVCHILSFQHTHTNIQVQHTTMARTHIHEHDCHSLQDTHPNAYNQKKLLNFHLYMLATSRESYSLRFSVIAYLKTY